MCCVVVVLRLSASKPNMKPCLAAENLSHGPRNDTQRAAEVSVLAVRVDIARQILQHVLKATPVEVDKLVCQRTPPRVHLCGSPTYKPS